MRLFLSLQGSSFSEWPGVRPTAMSAATTRTFFVSSEGAKIAQPLHLHLHLVVVFAMHLSKTYTCTYTVESETDVKF